MDNNLWFNILTIVISVLSLGGFGIVAKFFWEDRHSKKVQNTVEAKKRLKDENQSEMREVIREEIQPVVLGMGRIENQLEVNTTGTVTLLRDRMKCSLNYCRLQHWASASDKANWLELYQTYKNLGGNHFREYVDQWKQEMENLQSKEDYLASKSKPRSTTTRKNKPSE